MRKFLSDGIALGNYISNSDEFEFTLGSVNFNIDNSIVWRIKAITEKEKISINTFLLTAFATLLYKYTYEEESIIENAVCNDYHNSNYSYAFIKSTMNGNETFKNVCFRTNIQVTELSNGFNEESNYHHIIFDMVSMINDNIIPKHIKYGICIRFNETSQGMYGKIDFNSRVFNINDVKKFSEHFLNIIKKVTDNPEIKLYQIDMLSEEEKKQILVDFNNTKVDYPRDKSIYELFEIQAKNTPDNLAVVFKNNKLTYKQLNEKANSLARTLRDKGVKADSVVGIMAERSIEIIVGILAILKAGGAYLPIDADYPQDLIKYMLTDSNTQILLTQQKFVNEIEFEGSVLDLDDINNYHKNTINLNKISNAENLAYVIYTSGTTGRPKGVAVKQYSVVRLIKNTNYIEFKPSDRLLQTCAMTFDVATFEIWGALFNGIELHLTSKDVLLNANKLGTYLIENNITVMWLTSPLFNNICEQNHTIFNGLRCLLIGGDVVSPKNVSLVKKHAPNLTVINGYGPTENTTFSTCYVLKDKFDDTKSIPIGTPIANSTAYILDKHNMVVPIGVYGELCVGGDGLARGYLNKPELTAEKFIKNPHALGEMMYRTGDLVRWLPDGNIEFLGRVDHQVKIRGFRIELGEIENELLRIKDITQTIVVAKENAQGIKYLCAYLVAEKEITVPKLREGLSQRLPNYMIPAYFMQLAKMPLNINGKINRTALPEPTGDINTGVEYEAPRNEVEEKLTAIWSQVLEVDKIGINDDFFTLGGDSLKAMKIIALIHKELKTEVTVGKIFSFVTVKELAEYIGKEQESLYYAIDPVEEKELYQVSSAQKRMFTLNQLSKQELNYNIPSVFIFEGSLEISKVKESFKKLVERHEALRTSFEIVEDKLMQRVHIDVEFKLDYAKLYTSSQEQINAEIQKYIKPFNLSKAPLFRAKLIELSEKKHILILDMHHIISDGTSMDIIIEEFTKLYKGEELPQLKVQYKDYSAWVNRMLASDIMQKHEQYWTSIFNDEIPVLNLPNDYKRPSKQSFEGESIGFMLNKDLTQKLKNVCNVNGASLYMALLSAYNILLSKYSGQDDIVVGTAVADRPHADLQKMVGMFVNTLALRNYPKGNKTFNKFLQEVKQSSLNAYEHQDYQFDMLIDKLDISRDLSRNALFDTMFVLQNTDNEEIELDGVKIKQFNFTIGVSKFDITLEAIENDETIKFNLEYCTKLFKRESIERLIVHFINIIKTVSNNSDIKLCDIDMLSEEEKMQILVDFNNTKVTYPKHKTISELFEEQAEITPNKVAVVFNYNKLTYRELNEKANSLARTLRDKGVKADSVVGIMAERSIEIIVGILAILKAGGAYLPIDADYPKDRIKYMLTDSKTEILLTQDKFVNEIEFKGNIINLNDDKYYQHNTENLDKLSCAENLAYVIYTSGTTGRPKGVAVKQYSVVRLIKNTNYIEFKASDRLLQTCAMTFDVATFEIWGALFNGIELHLTNKDVLLNANKLGTYLIENNITVMWLTSPLFNNICDQNHTIFKGLRCLLIGGDVVSPKNVSLVKKQAPNLTVINGYGPTENTTFSTCYVIKDEFDDTKSIPIGTPIANSTAYILDKHNMVVPIGVYGELCVGGDGLARGYLNKPELTAEKYVENPHALGEIMYRTGDLVRWLPDGNIEFMGRVDHQVKIRGFRIELGEIENELLRIKEITQAIVVAQENAQGIKYLCAYLVSEQEITVPELREGLSQRLPNYMIPAYFMQLAKMPLNINGKVNRKALPEPTGDINTGVEYVAPRNEVEEKLTAIWSEVLQVEKISINDDFFSLGGDSLKAMKIIALIHKELKTEVTVGKIFSSITVSNLANYLNKTIVSSYKSIGPIEEKELYQVSSAQKRMFTLNQLSKQELNYNIPSVFIFEGSLEKSRVEESLKKLVERHEALRTSFEIVEDKLMQRVHKDVEFKLDYAKLYTSSQEQINAEIQKYIKPFNLSKAPLFRAKLIEIAEKKHVLILDMHHIISDGTSMDIIIEEFTKLYKGEELPQLKVQYKDYSDWVNRMLASDIMQKHEQYWTSIFSDEIPVLNLPSDYMRPSIQSFKGNNIRFTLDKHTTVKLKNVCSVNGASLYMALLSAYNILLSKYSGQDDIVVGTAAAGRPHADLQKMVGMFVNTLALRNYPKGNKTFNEFLQEVKQSSLNAYEHQDYQFDMLVDKLDISRDLSRNALFDTMFVLQNTDNEEIELDGVKIKQFDFSVGVSKFDITLEAEEKSGNIEFNLEYCTKLFKRDTIKRLIEHYINILDAVAENSAIKLAEIDMLSAKEKKQILIDFNDTKVAYPKHKTLSELFEEQVKNTPDNIAVVFNSKNLTYQELNKRANSLARTLRDKGVKADSVVGIMAERSIEIIVGILAILKAGGAYLPIDADYPKDRIKYMLENSGTKILLTQQKFVNEIEFEGNVIDLNDDKYYQHNTENLDKQSNAENLAYVIYTSGTTGRPKGVAVKQYSVVRLIKNTNYIEFKPSDRLLQTCAMTFDVATFEIWGALFNGIELHLTSKDVLLNANKLGTYLIENNITVMWLTSPLFNNICDQNHTIFKGLRCLLIGGDVVSPKNVSLIKKQAPNLTVINGYGPTENTTFSTCYVIEDKFDNTKSIPIGKPIANSTAYILDKHKLVVPIGVYGELCVGGDGLAKGYLSKPELTAEKFIKNPYTLGEIMYRTGDLVRWLPDGNIEFLGRVDHQVKIRGFRIELGEIENQLLKTKEITQVAVMAKENAQGIKYLCAYLVAEQEVTVSELRESLSQRLPDYMIPAYFMQLTKMPLNINGKINRKALPEPTGDINTGVEYVAPRNEVEEKVTAIWSEVLQVEKISINDDFFSLGGDSLKAINVVAIIQRELMIDVSVSNIFKFSTVKELAEYIGKVQESKYYAIETVKEKELYQVSSAQKRMFALNQFSQQETNYNIPLVKILDGKLQKNKVEESFNKLVKRHEALRTCFEVVDNEIVQRVHKNVEFKIEYAELNINSPEQINTEVIKFIKPFDLSKAPLFRVKLIKLSEEKHVFMLDMHHIISDGTSLSIIMNEFTKLYNDENLLELGVQYKDYSAWENKMLTSEVMQKHEEYWTSIFSDKIPILNLPTDYKRPSRQSFEGENIGFILTNDLTQKLKNICKANGATLYMVLLSAYNILLSKYSGQEDIVVGAAAAGRPHADLQEMVGMFVNTLALRNYPKGDKTFNEFLQEIKQNALKAYEHQDYQFDMLVDRLDISRDLSRSPLLDTMFVLQNTDNKEIEVNNLAIKDFDFRGNVSKLDITLEAIEKDKTIKFYLEYCTRLFKRETIERLIKHFINILETISQNPDIKLCNIDMLSEEEKKQILVDFNDTKVAYPKNKTIYEIFEEQAEITPNKVAVVFNNKNLTYRELNERANSLARILRDKGVKADSVVGIMAERSIEIIVGILAILKAGGAYLPIDVDYPKDRIKYMLTDSKTEILLTQDKFVNEIEYAGSIINLNDDKNYHVNTTNLQKINGAENLAYIIYTSGTTGRPKGVAVKQYSVVRLIKNTNYIEFKPSDRLLQTCAMTFDVATFEIWGALFNGIELHLTSKDVLLNANKLGTYLIENNITVMWLTSPLFNNICDQNHTIFNGLRCLLIGGDVVSPKNVSLIKKQAPNLTVINGYGPTENTTFSTCYVIKDEFDDTKSIPIGKPIANSTAYILDKHNMVVPIGVYGELCVGGDGLAKGYLNKPALTAEKFIKNPYTLGEMMYRTGDLVRWLPDGNIEFMGRVDHQVKIRGFRIELGEIENQLLKTKEITQVAVMAKENAQGIKYLCAYLVAEKEITVSELRESLSQRLPDYMIPAYFMQLAKMPLNINGKVNRKTLPEPTGDINTGVEYVAPRNEIEEKLTAIWSEVLQVEKISINDDFFSLGGDSLKAINVVSIIKRELMTEISVSDMFSYVSVKKLAKYIGKNRENKYYAIEPVNEKEIYQVSSAQKRMFALNQFSQQETNYNIPFVKILDGKLQKNKVEESFNKLVKRHEALRTSFELVNNEIVQRVHKNVKIQIEYAELNINSQEQMNAEIIKFIKPFDLSKAPLFRIKLIKLSEEKHVFMLDIHHIISDGTSLSIMMHEFAKLYNGEELSELGVQYKDYSAWENKMLTSEVMQKHEEYWINIFSDEIPVLNLPTDYKRPSRQSFEGENIGFILTKDLTQKLKNICKANGATLYMVLLSAYNILLSKYSGQEDIVVGAAAAGRPHVDLQKIVGMFVNTLALRNYPKGDKTFNEFLQEVKQNALKAYEHQDYQFNKLVEILDVTRDLSRSPLLDTMFVLQNTDNKEIEVNNLAIKDFDFRGNVSKFDLTLEAVEKDEIIKLNIEYCTRLFKRETIERLTKHFINIIEVISQNPDIKLCNIDMVLEEEKKQILVDFNDTKVAYPKNKTICEMFEEQVKNTPDNIAVVYENKKLTYNELNVKANSLARTLRDKGIKTNSIVSIMAERSLEMIIGIVAILKAGGAYLPIDADYPKDRIKYMLEDSQTSMLLTQQKFINEIEFGGNIINLNDDKYYQHNTENLDKLSNAENLAYVIYTSGTTGRPKGVAVKQYSVVRLIKNTNYIDFKPSDRLLQTCAMTFDVATFEIWGALFNGIELHLTTKDVILNSEKLGEYLLTNNITVMWLTSPLFNKLCEDNATIFKGLRCLLVGGDIVSPKNVSLVKKYAPELTVINGYGPTENTTFSTCYKIEHNFDDTKSIPIGKPIANSTTYIFDKYNKLVPVGVYGELCVGGDGLAQGYLNNPELTAKKFVKNPYVLGNIMYRTGDLVRWLPDGNIEFLGRVDHQVKIRGFRIELGEIENCLLRLNGMKEALVISREQNGNKYLCAYLVSEEEYNTSKLRLELKKSLPDYMIPAYFITLNEMPLNQSGKINRKALPIPDGNIETGVEYLEARNEIEEYLVKTWSEVLGVKKIGINDNFFALGGDSLKAINIVAIIQKELMIEISVSEIFRNSTISELAEFLNISQKKSYLFIKAVEEKELYEVSSAQKRMYALNQFSQQEINYNIPIVRVLEGKLDKYKLEESFNRLIERHEAFRTSFEMVDNEIIQRIHKDVDFKVEYTELNTNSQEQINVEVQKFIKPFNLAKAPLLRVKLIKLQEEKHMLMLDMHHIISDGVSLSIIMNEFTKLYKGKELAKLKVQYKDYAAWENNMLTSEYMQKRESYWINMFRDEIPVLNLPTDYARPSFQSFAGESLEFKLDKGLTQNIKNICKINGATLYMALLSAYNILLSKYSGQEDILIGSPIAGRQDTDLNNMIGMFVNTLVMRNYPGRNKTFNEFLKEVKKNALSAYENQDYPFDRLVEKLDVNRDLSRNALFDVMFILQNTDNKDIELDNINIKQFDFVSGVSKFDMTLVAEEKGEEIEFKIDYSTKLFKKQTIEKMINHFTNILNEVVENPNITLGNIDMLSAEEKRQILVDFNNTFTEYPKDKTIIEYFEQQVEKVPNNFAVAFEGKKLTYQELNEKANQIASVLRDKGVKPDTIVGIMVERSLEMMIGVMGILKSGAAYMPISPEYPDDRIQYMLEDSQATILLTQKQFLNTIAFDGSVIDLEDSHLYQQAKTNIEHINKPNDLAYIIYTSGSTGKPKGVMIQHGNVINLVTALNKNIYDQYEDYLKITLIAPYVFDASVKQIFASLLNGHCLCIVPEEYRYMGEKLVEFYIDNSIDISDGTPSHFKLILGDNTQQLKDIPVKQFIIGGEELPVNVVKEFLAFFDDKKPKITNIYGPTECCVDTTAFLVESDQLDKITSIPIGSPLANYQVYVLDKTNKLQPVGVAGELCIAGDGLARGYLNRPKLTKEKFVDNPFIPNKKMYKTGDLVTWLPNGNIEFMGRIDHQVKIRGYRIEIGEIDSVIKSHISVQDSVVIAKEDGSGEKRLVAYIVANNDEDYSDAKLKEYLKNKLPKYMIPAVFMQLESIPLNSNGKVDRFALPEPDMQKRGSDDSYIEPRNKAEKEMAEIWSNILGIDRIGIDDDFFDLGGDSFKAIKLVRSVSSSLGVMQLFKNSTIRELVAYLSKDICEEKTMLNELTKPVKDKDRIASLICFPFGGGSAISYQPLANALPKNYSLYAVELPGHDFSRQDEDLVSIEESAARCLEEIKQTIKGPIVLYGHCLGATMAVLLASKLEEEGIQVDGVFVGAMFPAPRISNIFFDMWEKIFPTQLTTRGNRDLLRTIGGLSSEISAEETDFILRNLKHDSKECTKWYTEVYKDKQKPKFKAPITCVIGDGDRITEFYQERYYEWEHFSDEVDLRTINDGGHFFFKNQANELAMIIKEKIDIWQGRNTVEAEAAATKDKQEKVVKLKSHRKKHVRPSIQLFLTVAIVQIISEIGSFLAYTGCTLWILEQTGALSSFAIMLLFRIIPEILILPFAGAIVDKFSRRVIMILGDIFATIGSMFLLLMMLNNSLEIGHIYVFTVIASIANCFRQPAYWAAITQITPKMYLAQANSVANFSLAIGGIIASFGSGFLMHNIKLSGIIVIDLISFSFAIIVLLLVRFPNTMFNKSEEPILKEILGGCRFILKRHSMIAMVVFFVVMNFFYNMFEPTIITLLESTVSLKMFGVIHAFIGIGGLFGAMVMLFTGGLRKRAKGMVGFVIPIAISMIIGALRPSPIFIAISLFGVFASVNILDIHWRSLIQVKVGLELQGRVFAVNRMLVSMFIPLSYLSAGVLSDKIFVNLLKTQALNSPIASFILAPGIGRAMRLTLLVAGILLFIWSLLGISYKPLMQMDDILEDASVGEVVIKDKDKLQEMIDKKYEGKIKVGME